LETDFSASHGDLAANLMDRERAERLKSAVKSAGGNKHIALKSNVPLTTLNAYLRGGEMKLSNAFAIAEACGVTLEWLTTGRGSLWAPQTQAQSLKPEAAQTTPGAPVKLAHVVNMEVLTEAIEDATRMAQARQKAPNARQLAQLIVLAYDEFIEESR